MPEITSLECLAPIVLGGISLVGFALMRLKNRPHSEKVIPYSSIPDDVRDGQDIFNPGHSTAESVGAKTVPNVLDDAGPRRWESPMAKAPNTKNGHSSSSLN